MVQTTQRACIRLPCDLEAEIKFSGGTSEITKKATVSNISTTGIQILSSSFVATGQKLTASFKVPGQSAGKYQAEIMRIESLQGRMIGRYSYALGARFVDFTPKQEKQITHFITGKLSCRPWRISIMWLFIALAGSELIRIIAQTYLTQTAASSIWTDTALPLLSAFLSAGFLLSAAASLLNQKKFTHTGLIFAGMGAILSAFRIALKLPLLSESETGALIWTYEAVIFAIEAGLIVTLIKMAGFFNKMEKVLAAEKISPGTGRPTFTIL